MIRVSEKPWSGFEWLMAVVLGLFVIAALGVWADLWATDWLRAVAEPWLSASSTHWFGTNAIGQDIFSRALAGIATAFEVGAVVTVVAVALGGLLGALAGGFAGRTIDRVVSWLINVFDAIPFYLFAGALAVVLREHPYGMQLAMICTFWTTTARVVRAEVIKLLGRDFIVAAFALGASPLAIARRHLLPNTIHLWLVQAGITFVAAIKTEVVLSFLGLGTLQRVSWGSMMAEAGRDMTVGHVGNLVAATGLLFLLVFSVTVLTDGMTRRADVRGE